MSDTAAQTFEHLNLTRWPMNVVPDDEAAGIWIGRPRLHRQVERLIRGAARIRASQLVLIWADYGSGKTHTLRHIKVMARDNPALVPIYVVTPRGLRSFMDLYRAIIEALDRDGVLLDVGMRLFASKGAQAESNLEAALLMIAMQASAQASLARGWLRGDSVHLRDLRSIGISRRLEKAPDGIDTLDELIGLITGQGGQNVLLLVDEVQEFSELGGKALAECVGGLHKLFDRHTQGLTLVLSFTTASQTSVRGIIGDALFDRASARIELPVLTTDEAVELISGLIAARSIDPSRAPFPFDESAIKYGVEWIDRRGAMLSPRTVIKAFDQLLRDAELDIEDGELECCDEAYVRGHIEDAISEE